jgi:putative DNA methylase
MKSTGRKLELEDFQPLERSERLIDRGMLRYEASISGAGERYRRGETSHTVHVWWARRPHTAMRALAFSCLCHDASDASLDLMADLTASSRDTLALSLARTLCRNGKDRPPRTLDMFGGGGTIPFECALLGAEAYSIDSNELSVFIQRCLLEYSQALEVGELKRLVARSGARVIERIKVLTDPLFPNRAKVGTYFWTYGYECSGCGYEYLLLKRPWLSQRNGKKTGLVIATDKKHDTVSVLEEAIHLDHPSRWVGRNGTSACPKCETQQPGMSVANCQDRLIAVCEKKTRGKSFRVSSAQDLPPQEVIRTIEQEGLTWLGAELPTSLLPKWSGIVNPSIYGMDTHADVYNGRQRASLICVLRALGEEFDAVHRESGSVAAKSTIGLLSGLIDQSVDWNSRLSMWISQNEQAGRAFCGPGVAMMWDYAETDPLGGGPSNLQAKLERILVGCDALLQLPAPVNVRKAYAQDLPFESGFFDAIITDPPYYDNIYYNILADFFFAWKRILFSRIEPELFAGSHTDWSRELVASKNRSGSKTKAHSDYCTQLGQAVKEAARVLSDDGVFSLVYSHSSLNGWEALIRAYRASGLSITGIEPLSIERKQRPRAVTSEAINTCMVFVARKCFEDKKIDSLTTLVGKFERISSETIGALRASGWADEDSGIAAFAQGVGMLMNIAGTTERETDHAIMQEFTRVVNRMAPGFKVGGRGSL